MLRPLLAAKTPRTIWVELTSKCPFDCVFCSRKTLRGAGEHMPFEMFESLIRQLSDPRTLLLNYSGESTAYPDLIPAIRLARSTGAFVELVTALASVSESMLPALSASGLNRLTVSIHATDPAKYSEIYRYGSFEVVRSRLTRFLELCRTERNPPIVDCAFVAMDQNLGQLTEVAGFVNSLGLRDIYIFPVIRRDEIPVQFPGELTVIGEHRPDFEERVKAAVRDTRNLYPNVALNICNPAFTAGNKCLGEVPVPYPWLLPKDARIHTCEQNPWETAHVLSNGDVVACEVLDKTPLGNLTRETLAEIWHGEAYQRFRERYHRGESVECRSCPWKKAYRPGPLQSEIIGSRGTSAQLVHGWHDPSNEEHVWSSQQALAVLAPRPGSSTVHVCGMLPPGPDGSANELAISCNGAEPTRFVNPWDEVMTLSLDIPIAASPDEPLFLEFRTRHVYRPSERNGSPDQRDLGFGLLFLVSKPPAANGHTPGRTVALQALRQTLRAVDVAGRCLPRRRVERADVRWAPGLSILIPERENLEELSTCLASVEQAVHRWQEPLEVIVVVNGSKAEDYRLLRTEHASVQWQFHAEPLGFSAAVRAGLSQVHFDWVYLLNNDVALEPDALDVAARYRESSIFAIGSQIVFKDATRYRDETNWTALLIEDGLATIHDRIPESDDVVDSFYAGGAASLFQTGLLRSFVQEADYDPFYWEDVEWGWRARKLGYRCVFCPQSVAHHSHRSTIARHYTTSEVETVLQRNRLLFQLRNLTRVGSMKRVFDEIAHAPPEVAEYFKDRRVLRNIVRERWWNHRMGVRDDEILAGR